MRFITKNLHTHEHYVINDTTYCAEWRGSLMQCDDYVNWANNRDFNLTEN